MASGYNTTPRRFAETRQRLNAHLEACGRDAAAFPDLISTMWIYVATSQNRADAVLRDVLAPALRRDADQLAGQLPVGTPEHCIELLRSYAEAGTQQILLWPIIDPALQLRQLHDTVLPQLAE